jgi:hypothetical protein
MVIKDAVNAVTEGLRGSPVALGLVVINVVFVVLMFYLLQQVSGSIERRDTMISEIIKHCYSGEDKK